MSPEALDAMNRQLKNQRDRLAEAVTDADRFSARVARLESAEQTGGIDKMETAASDGNLTRMPYAVKQRAVTRYG